MPGLVIIRVLVDVLNNGAKENRKRFAATGRRVYQSAPAIDDVLPCFLLECKRLPALCSKPVFNDLVSFGSMNDDLVLLIA